MAERAYIPIAQGPMKQMKGKEMNLLDKKKKKVKKKERKRRK